MGKQTETFLADALFQPIQLGSLELANRIVMAPMTRNRADPGNVPAEMTIEYYAQRASVGLIIAEATQVSDTAQGYANTPGLHTPEQIATWKSPPKSSSRRQDICAVVAYRPHVACHLPAQ